MFKKIAALMMAMMMLCGIALADTGVAPETVVLTVNGKETTVQELKDSALALYNEGLTDDAADYDYTMDRLIREGVLLAHLEEAGYLNFTEDEEKAFEAEAQAEWDTYLDTYVEYYLTEDTAEARAQLREQAAEYFASLGGTLEVVLDYVRNQAALDKLEADLIDGYEPTEEEIKAIFDLYGAQYKAQYENNVGMYEFYTQYYGYESWYVPEGYRSVIHILLEVDDDLMNAFTEAQTALDEAESAETVDQAAVAEASAKLEEARAAVIASRQDTIDEIYARLEKGESFQSLIAEYGSDEGMKQESVLAEGIPVHAESILYDPAFTEGAFQEGMTEPGSVSKPVVGSYGIHILYYLKDIPGGLIMTDAIRAEIVEYLVSEKASTAFNAGYAEWEKNVEVVRFDDVVEQLKAEAAEAQAD